MPQRHKRHKEFHQVFGVTLWQRCSGNPYFCKNRFLACTKALSDLFSSNLTLKKSITSPLVFCVPYCEIEQTVIDFIVDYSKGFPLRHSTCRQVRHSLFNIQKPSYVLRNFGFLKNFDIFYSEFDIQNFFFPQVSLNPTVLLKINFSGVLALSTQK